MEQRRILELARVGTIYTLKLSRKRVAEYSKALERRKELAEEGYKIGWNNKDIKTELKECTALLDEWKVKQEQAEKELVQLDELLKAYE